MSNDVTLIFCSIQTKGLTLLPVFLALLRFYTS